MLAAARLDVGGIHAVAGCGRSNDSRGSGGSGHVAEWGERRHGVGMPPDLCVRPGTHPTPPALRLNTSPPQPNLMECFFSVQTSLARLLSHSG